MEKTIMETIEQHLQDVFKIMRKEIPSLTHLTFDLAEYYVDGKVHGATHIGGNCELFNDVNELIKMVSDAKERRVKNELLYRKF